MRIEGTVGLRIEQHSPEAPERVEESAGVAARGRGPRRGRILIMDDERMIRETMRRQLVIFGYEVVSSVNGEEAVAAYREAREAGQPFDAVILDLMVDNGWGGERTLSELLRLDPGVKALVCSGTLSAPAAEYRRKGFCGVLGKPYAMMELRSLVEGALPGDPG